MRVNGKKVHIARDKLGPYDAYYEKGCMLSVIPRGKKVVKAFDYDGAHIGILQKDWKIGQALLTSLVPILVGLIVLGYCTIVDSSKVYCIIYRPTQPYRIDDNTVGINITNFSDGTLYIHVEDKCYPLDKGDTLISVPLSLSDFVLTLEYNGHFYEEDVHL